MTLVKVDYPVDLRLVAECVDVPVEQMIDLNPSLLRRTTPKDQSFDLRLPEGSKEKYETAIATIPVEKRVAWRYYKVQPGDTLAGIARKYRTTERAIAQANNLEGTAALRRSQTGDSGERRQREWQDRLFPICLTLQDPYRRHGADGGGRFWRASGPATPLERIERKRVTPWPGTGDL